MYVYVVQNGLDVVYAGSNKEIAKTFVNDKSVVYVFRNDVFIGYECI